MGLTLAGFLLLNAQTEPTFRASVSLVHVDAAVYSQGGRIVEGLTKDDFRVFDEGEEQPLTRLSTQELPLDLILLFDASASMNLTVKQVAEAADEGLRELRKGDRVSVMAFNTEIFSVTPFTEDHRSTALDIQDILRRRLRGNTNIQRSVDQAAKRMMVELRTDRRRAVLVITDNLGTPVASEAPVVRDFWEADTVLNGLIVRSKSAGFQTRLAIVTVLAPYAVIGGIEHIAAKTGGDTIRADDPGSAFRDMMHRIRSRYDLYYSTPDGKPGTFRNIRVELSAAAQHRFPGARISARRGYKLMPPS